MFLPNELLEEILDYLISDPKSLAPCARAAKRMYPIARSRIFRKICLVYGTPANAIFVGHETMIHGTPKMFQSILDTSPHIAADVLELQIHQFTSTRALERAQEAVLNAIVPSLVNLCALSFPTSVDSFEHYQTYHAINAFPRHNRTGIMPFVEEMLRNEAIIKFDLSNIHGFPAAVLQQRQDRLQRLSIQANLKYNTNEPLPPRQGTLLEVDELALYQVHEDSFEPAIRWLLDPNCCISRSSVRSLDIRFLVPMGNQLKDDHLDRLIRLFPNVESLYLLPNPNVATGYMGNDCDDLLKEKNRRYSPPNLRHLDQLRTLTLQFELYTKFVTYRLGFSPADTAFGSSLEWVTALLNTFSPSEGQPAARPNGIRKITLFLEFKTLGLIPHRYMYKKYFHRVPAWADLVGVLLSGAFPALREVEIDILVADIVKSTERTQIRETLRRMDVFSRLRDKGIRLLI